MQTCTKDRSAEFEKAVIVNFKFLEVDYDCKRRSSRPQKYTQIVKYENTKLYVILSYGPPAYEPEMSFGRKGIDDVPGAYSFHPGDLIQLDCCRKWAWNKEQGNALESWVAELARLLTVCGAQCLTDDQSVFTQMKDRRDKLILEWQREERNKGISREIDAAWKVKDYLTVVNLCLVYEGELNSVDLRRLIYAKKRYDFAIVAQHLAFFNTNAFSLTACNRRTKKAGITVPVY